MTRSVEDKIMNTAEVVIVNGKEFSPKRYSVYQVQSIINEAREKAKRIAALQNKALRMSKLASDVDMSKIDMSNDKQLALMQEALSLKADFDYETSDTGYHFDLIKRSYPELTEEDLEAMTEDEYEAAIEAIFEVNPSLKKMKAVILSKGLTNQNT